VKCCGLSSDGTGFLHHYGLLRSRVTTQRLVVTMVAQSCSRRDSKPQQPDLAGNARRATSVRAFIRPCTADSAYLSDAGAYTSAADRGLWGSETS